MPEANITVHAKASAARGRTYASFNATQAKSEGQTFPLPQGENLTLHSSSIGTAGNTSHRGQAGGTLISVSIEVPAFTCYMANLTLSVYSYWKAAVAGGVIYGRMYSCGTDPNGVTANYYASSNSPANYIAGAYSVSCPNYRTTSKTWNHSGSYAFVNSNNIPTVIRRYFVLVGGHSTYDGVFSFKTYAQFNGIDGVQRLVPTSYDVEYDQLRHSLEEEYYEAIRLDENYPTEADPPRFVPTFSGPLHVSNSEQTKLLNIIFYFNVTTVTPLSPSPYLPRRNDSTRRCPCKRRWTAERSFPVPIPCTMRT